MTELLEYCSASDKAISVNRLGIADTMTAFGRLLPLVKGSFGSVSAGENHPMCWSNPMQTTGQVECKWVVKSVQLGTKHNNAR